MCCEASARNATVILPVPGVQREEPLGALPIGRSVDIDDAPFRQHYRPCVRVHVLALDDPNRADFRVDILPERIQDQEHTVATLSNLLGFSADEAADLRTKLRNAPGFQAVPVASGLDYEKFAAVSVRLPELPGVIPQRGYSRFYPTGPAVGHLIGYVGVMGRQDGVEYLVRAMHHIVVERGRTDIGCAIIGNGPEVARLKELVQSAQEP